jgi:hypothetical protein
MSLPLKDVHIRLSQERHGAAAVFADLDGESLVEWCRRVVEREIDRRVHEATVVATQLHRLGLSGSERVTEPKA